MFASIGVVEEEGVMEVERALACSRFVVYLALTPLALMPWGELEPEIALPLTKGRTGIGNWLPLRIKVLPSTPPLIREVGGKQRFSGKR